MRPHEIEAWVLNIVDRLKKGQPIEDARVELKRDWPAEPPKAARRIAGHANAARGEPILWIVGIDEKARTFPGVEAVRLSDWIEQIRKQFNGAVPELQSVNVPAEGVTLMGLLFYTDRAPFVVKTGLGVPQFEVPYREGENVWSADRGQLLRILAPPSYLPETEVLFGRLEAELSSSGNVNWQLDLGVYLVPIGTGRLVVPRHRCAISFAFPGVTEPVAMKVKAVGTGISAAGAGKSVTTFLVGGKNEQVEFEGPSRCWFQAGHTMSPGSFEHVRIDLPVEITLTFRPIPGDAPCIITANLDPSTDNIGWVWRFNNLWGPTTAEPPVE